MSRLLTGAVLFDSPPSHLDRPVRSRALLASARGPILASSGTPLAITLLALAEFRHERHRSVSTNEPDASLYMGTSSRLLVQGPTVQSPLVVRRVRLTKKRACPVPAPSRSAEAVYRIPPFQPQRTRLSRSMNFLTRGVSSGNRKYKHYNGRPQMLAGVSDSQVPSRVLSTTS